MHAPRIKEDDLQKVSGRWISFFIDLMYLIMRYHAHVFKAVVGNDYQDF